MTKGLLATAHMAGTHGVSSNDYTTTGALALIVIGGLGALAFAASMVARRFLPVSEVVAFLVVGIVLGPSAFAVIDRDTLDSLQPLTSVALGAMVFLIGRQLRRRTLARVAHTLTPVAVVGNIAVAGITFIVMRAGGLSVEVAYLLAAMAPSTAPVTVRALVSEKRAAGQFTENLLGATAINNAVAAVLFGLGAPIAFSSLGENVGTSDAVVTFAQIAGASVGIGVAGAVVLRLIAPHVDAFGERFLLVWVTLILVVGASRYTGTSVVITTLVMGASVAAGDLKFDPLFESVRVLEAPIFLVFFVVTGASVHLHRFVSLGAIGVGYLLVRSVTRVGATWVAWVSAAPRSQRAWGLHLGAAQLPYAGMAVGFASFTVEKATQLGFPDTGQQVATIILGSVFIFELLSPLFVDRALVKSGDAGRADDVVPAASEEPVRAG